MATNLAVQQEALTRAVSSQSIANYAAIIRGFMAKGLAESEISPRENVFTYNAWKALGRQVKKGEHGVRCLTFIMQTNKRTGREEKRPWSTTVFHISQTEKIDSQAVREFDREGARERVAENTARIADDHDATPENVPYAGEEEDTNGYPQLSPKQTEILMDIIAPDTRPVCPETNGHSTTSPQCSECGGFHNGNPYALAPQLSIEDLHTELETSGAKFEHVQANEVDWLLTPAAPVEKFSPDATVETFTLDENCKLVRETDPEVIPAPAPKDSAYDRAMRGEPVNIMDMIDEFQKQPAKLPRRLQSAGFQSKTVEF